MEVNKQIIEEVLDDIQADIAEFGDDPWLNSMLLALHYILTDSQTILPEDVSEGSKSGQQLVSNAYWAKLKSKSKD
jgi:hypothetical protein